MDINLTPTIKLTPEEIRDRIKPKKDGCVFQPTLEDVFKAINASVQEHLKTMSDREKIEFIDKFNAGETKLSINSFVIDKA